MSTSTNPPEASTSDAAPAQQETVVSDFAGAVEPAMQVWTMQLGKWRKAKALDIHVLNITAQSGWKVFAPEMYDVLDYKAGYLSEELFTQFYLDKMKWSREEQAASWALQERHQKIALACYCRPEWFCHRRLFAPLFKEYMEEKGHTVILKGELV